MPEPTMTDPDPIEPDPAGPLGGAHVAAPEATAAQRKADMGTFFHLLGNTAIANVTTSFLWFGLTFWAYLETKSVLATSIIGGSYMLLVAIFGVIFGAIVDHHKKKRVMVASALITLACFSLAGGLYLIFPVSTLIDWSGPWFWVFAGIILFGAVVENMRNIALSTTVTLLVPADSRDKANGMVGTVHGIAFMVTSVFSGLSIGFLGMGWTMVIAIVLIGLSLLHLVTVRLREPGVVRAEGELKPKFQFRGAIPAIALIPGLGALIAFSTFNNLVGGVFMALMDPYGLTLFSVQLWGVLLGVTSIGFIVGGGLVAKFGLGKSPVRTMLLANVAVAILGMTFTIRESGVLFVVGIFMFMAVMPLAEAAEQTIIQKVVPYEKQGRVFGFAQSVESASAPISSFLIGPIAQFMLIPLMASPRGQQMFGWLLGSGEARGIALVFVGASLIMLAAVCVAFVSRPYRRLTHAFSTAPESAPAPV